EIRATEVDLAYLPSWNRSSGLRVDDRDLDALERSPEASILLRREIPVERVRAVRAERLGHSEEDRPSIRPASHLDGQDAVEAPGLERGKVRARECRMRRERDRLIGPAA